MIPWFSSHTYAIGPLVLQTWGTFVAAGFLIGGWMAAKRAVSRGLDPKIVWDLVFWIFVAAFIGARAFHVLAYEPVYYLAHPWEAIDPRKPGYAIMGGFLGAWVAFYLIIRKRGLDMLSYADTLVWGLPWGCGVGRIGCFLIHDHPGTLTSFALGVRYPDGQTRHDLGLYLSLFGFFIGLVFVWLGRKQRRAGFYLGSFLVIYGVGRFVLDFLRVLDRRAFGLTPTQWILLAFVGMGAWLLVKGRGSINTPSAA
jgi:phosphatidylglycerol---prolipoprotein diacylglyceryl transferase